MSSWNKHDLAVRAFDRGLASPFDERPLLANMKDRFGSVTAVARPCLNQDARPDSPYFIATNGPTKASKCGNQIGIASLTANIPCPFLPNGGSTIICPRPPAP